MDSLNLKAEAEAGDKTTTAHSSSSSSSHDKNHNRWLAYSAFGALVSSIILAYYRDYIPKAFLKALRRAAEGGLAGAAAMAINVCSLMWIRTVINYQYRYGKSMEEAFQILYADGGVFRFYRGVGPALLQGPLSRFGDTAANTGMLAILDAFELTSKLPVGVKTICASIAAGLFRILLMPIDTIKTTM